MYYYKGIPTCLLTNLNIQLGIVNKTYIMVFEIIPNLKVNISLC